MTDIYGGIMDGLNLARQGAAQHKQRGLASLVGQAYSAPQQQRGGLLAQIAGIDPATATQTQSSLGAWDDSKQEALVRSAKLLLTAPEEARPQVWAQIVQAGEIPGLQAAYDPVKVPEMAQRIVQQFGGAGQPESFTLAPGSKRFAPDGSVIAEVPFAPSRPQNATFQVDQEGNGWWLSPGQPPIPAFGGGGVSGGAAQVLEDAVSNAPIGDVQSLITNLASQFGGQVSSLTRSPDKNAKVGGVPNSQHLSGTAGDVVIRDPAQRRAYIDAARAAGLEVIDEGDHVHAELPPRGQVAAGPRFGKPHNGQKPPAGYQWDASGSQLVAIPGGPADRKLNPIAADVAQAEMGMRKELQDRLKNQTIVLDMFRKVQEASKQASAPNDLALIFAYMKMLDPGSVVREQEFANAQNAAGIPDRVRNAYNKALRGERLNADQRQEFLSSAQQIADLALDQVTAQTRQYQDMADQYKFDPVRATGAPDFRNVNQPAPMQTTAADANATLPPLDGSGVLRWNPATGDFE